MDLFGPVDQHQALHGAANQLLPPLPGLIRRHFAGLCEQLWQVERDDAGARFEGVRVARVGYLAGEHTYCPKCDEELIARKQLAAQL